MRDPRNLEVADDAMDLAELTYVVTKAFPSDERFGLVAQMRRAAISVGSNIAEGCGRTTDRAFTSFLQIALGSVLELEYQAQIAARLGHGDPLMIQDLCRATGILKRKLVSLTNAIRRRKISALPMRAGGAAAVPAP
jgi:four helix bundle protein